MFRVGALHQSKLFFMLFALILLCFRVDGKDVLEFLGDKSKANEEDASLVIAQLVEALCYLHRQNVVHLDIRVRKKVEKLLDVCRYQASEKRREKTRKKTDT